MNYWVISPNVTNHREEEPSWKAAIEKHQVAIMGWEEHNKFGRMFIEDVQKGDIILVAQGANWQKRLFLAGRVASDAYEKHLPDTPRTAWQRQLVNCIGKADLNTMGLDFNGSAYGETSQIPALYKLKPLHNEKDKAITEQLETAINKKLEVEAMKNIIDLLKYKKQIILQGPPGTGKTRLAKEIAKDLTAPNEITADDVKRIVEVGQKVESIADRVPYKVINIDNAGVSLQLENGSIQKRNYNNIIQAYSNLIQNKPLTGGDAYQAAVAKYIHENWEDERTFKIIQFHPCYSYEDFVRGIVAKLNEEGEGILYEAENKLLAAFADTAQQNYLNSQKPSETISKEQWLDSEFEHFVKMVENEVSQNGKFVLNEYAYIYQVDDHLFRYSGDNWKVASRRRLKFRDLKNEFLAEVQERQDIKKLTTISSEAREEATYGLIMVEKLREFLKERQPYLLNPASKEQLQNYVLIIDEINRANLSSVLGELIYALEYRSENVESMYEIDGSNALVLPPNLYIIGTMNTADRSVGHIDYAIRRRFAFVDVLPENLTTNDEIVFHQKLFRTVAELFVANLDEYIADSNTLLTHSEHLSKEFLPKDVWLGHSYFLQKKVKDTAGNVTLEPEFMAIRVRYEIKPLLEEYIKDGVLVDNDKLRGIIKNLESQIS